MYFNKKKYVYYIFEKLIMQYDIEHKIDKLADATIIIVDHQPNTKGKIRDNDNSDSHDIINLINKYIQPYDDDEKIAPSRGLKLRISLTLTKKGFSTLISYP